jgi:hypothetical protein
MKNFQCACGHLLFFENTSCVRCQRLLGYDPAVASMLPLQSTGTDIWHDPHGRRYRLCENYRDYNVCNWLVPASSSDSYCLACSLNQVVPSPSAPQNHRRWANMEAAKRRLLYTLLQLRLPIRNKQQDTEHGLAFAFMEDNRSNPGAEDNHILTGHAAGLITVNLTEADDVARESMRETMGEAYRTLLGHFRHESGHYFFDLLVSDSPRIEAFRQLFGDDRQDYAEALETYHAGAKRQDVERYISTYAQSHPLEDWAESWAHYLHMLDTLETATQYGMADAKGLSEDFACRIEAWTRLTLALNSLNRSMGLKDAYPFVISPAVYAKLNFVHAVLYPR